MEVIEMLALLFAKACCFMINFLLSKKNTFSMLRAPARQR
jgi:hypothetical protein